MTLKESASKMKNALKLFRPHLPPCSITRAFSLVRQHGDKEPHLSGEISFFPFFFLFRENGSFTMEKNGTAGNEETSKATGKIFNCAFQSCDTACL